MALKEGDFVKIDYSIWRHSDNTIVRTTDKAVAEKNGVYDSKIHYGPQLVVLGRDNTIKGISDTLIGMDAGQAKKFELSPGQAYGERNKDLVRVMPLSDFRKRDMNPSPGMQMDLDGAIATVVSVNSGRVMVDANHPLAGERITCELKVVSRIDDQKEKVKAAFERYGLTPSSVDTSAAGAKVAFDSKVKKDSDFLINKANAVAFAFAYIDSIKSIKVEEEYSKEAERTATEDQTA
ncbi:MAG: peptidylprolyl isomerase [Candidatus Marsarchaeota archaeon]|nr:peptidylprolyl isomerase [Candidatus Marsarchaeota archaeon]